jgi:hypothetical protein
MQPRGANLEQCHSSDVQSLDNWEQCHSSDVQSLDNYCQLS